MTRNEITRRFPNASEAFIKKNINVHKDWCGANYPSTWTYKNGEQKPNLNVNQETFLHDDNSRPITKLEPDIGHASLETSEVQENATERVLVRVTSKRKRLIDEDNLCEKYHVDLLRYAGILQDDSPEQTKIEVSQIKCKKGEAEEITIEVFQL